MYIAASVEVHVHEGGGAYGYEVGQSSCDCQTYKPQGIVPYSNLNISAVIQTKYLS